MEWQWTGYTLPLLVGVALLSLVAGYLLRRWRREAVPGIGLATGLVACIAVTLWFYVLELSVTALDAKVLFNQLQYLGLAPTTGFLLAYVLVYTGREDLMGRRTYAILFTPAALAILAVFTNDVHWQFWTGLRLHEGGPYVSLDNDHGPAYAGFLLYTYAYGVTSVVLLGRRALDAESVHRLQIAAMSVGASAPMVGGILYVLGVVPDHFPTLPYLGFLVTAAAFAWPVFRHDLFGIVPVARRTVVEQLDDGVIAVDGRGVVVSANATAARLLEYEGSSMVGQPAADVLAPVGDVVCRAIDGEKRDEPESGRERGVDDCPRATATLGDRIVDVSISPLTQSGHRVGRIVRLADVTERHNREEQLRRQNAYLDEFAEVVSHDIATPLGVIENRARLVELTGDTEHVEDVFASTERIRRLMDELLELARQGKRVDDTGPVDLDAVSRSAWESVPTTDAVLSADASIRIDASSSRLRQLLENLFRNSVEHGSTSPRSYAHEDSVEHNAPRTSARDASAAGPETAGARRTADVPAGSRNRSATTGSDGGGEATGTPTVAGNGGTTGTPNAAADDATTTGADAASTPDSSSLRVRVVAMEGGFAVEDDGVGIPAAECERVFERGYSSTDDGTGLGLAIVRRIAEAHGWRISATASDAGGARFEVRGVEIDPQRS